MAIQHTAFWHKASYDLFLNAYLPQLLAQRVPLASYRVEPEQAYTCQITISIAREDGELPLVFRDFPQPDAQGVFEIDGGRRTVFPIASTEALDAATIACVGEQLRDFIAERLGHAPAHLPWDAALVRAWLPLDLWVREFLTPIVDDVAAHHASAQWLDQTNWLATQTHLRRILVRTPERLFTDGQLGRVCPFEVPEGSNMGRIFTIAVGAAIRDGRLVVEEERPSAMLGLSASAIPFLEHDDLPRLLMGTNMMRQWLVPPDPEPALVQTGNEPTVPAFWCGRNLLTAFIAWDGDTFEDGIVISESCVRRLGYPRPIELGDKLSNRHGAKGVVSQILPDAAMPRLADGTSVELIFSVMSLASRMNFGQVREAVMSRIARAEGQIAIVPPFAAPNGQQLHERLVAAGLAADGMEQLTLGEGQHTLERRSTVGWVYWGKLIHQAREKLRVWTGTDTYLSSFGTAESGELYGESVYQALRTAEAYQTILELFNTRAARRPAAMELAHRLASGPIAQAPPPTPLFSELQRRLRAGGVEAAFAGEQITFRFVPPEGEVLHLAQSLPHPWLPEHTLETIGMLPELPEYAALTTANQRLGRLLASHAPEPLQTQARSQLQLQLGTFFAALLGPEHLAFKERALWSGRAVATPAPYLSFEQVGLPEAIAWQLFEPLLARELDSAVPVERHESGVTAALDLLMARSWVVVHRVPSITAHSFLAFRPVRVQSHAIGLPLLGCELLDTDFDGDHVGMFLPITELGQHEAGEQLTIVAQLARDPRLLEAVRPRMDALLALALHSLTSEGRAEIDVLANTPVPTPDGFLTRQTVVEAMQAVMAREGARAALAMSERLMRRGFELARGSGVSLSPFVGEDFLSPPTPQNADPEAWNSYVQEVIERLAATRDYSRDFGALVLAAKSGARSNGRQLAWTISARGSVPDATGKAVAIKHGYRDGLTPNELFALVPGARDSLQTVRIEWERLSQPYGKTTYGYGVLARARRSPRPGSVFALAAIAGEVDTLADHASRLFVGLPPLAELAPPAEQS